jgi:hypothetical protein
MEVRQEVAAHVNRPTLRHEKQGHVEAQPTSVDCRGHCVIGSDPAGGQDVPVAQSTRLGEQELELASLAAAVCFPRELIAFDVEARETEPLSQHAGMLDRRGQLPEAEVSDFLLEPGKPREERQR